MTPGAEAQREAGPQKFALPSCPRGRGKAPGAATGPSRLSACLSKVLGCVRQAAGAGLTQSCPMASDRRTRWVSADRSGIGSLQPSRCTGAPSSLGQSCTLSGHTQQEVGGGRDAEGALRGGVDTCFASGRPRLQCQLCTLLAQGL